MREAGPLRLTQRPGLAARSNLVSNSQLSMERPGVAEKGGRDPILEAYHLWEENGWEDCAAGCTAVTSLMRVHQVLTQRDRKSVV